MVKWLTASNGIGARSILLAPFLEEHMDKLAEQIRSDLVRIGKADKEWVEGTLSLCQHLLEARNKHPSNNNFGDWLKSNQLTINEMDRKALLNMAEELPLA